MQTLAAAAAATATAGEEIIGSKRPRLDGSISGGGDEMAAAFDADDESYHFPVEEIVEFPLPGCASPGSISFSPDDRIVSYLFSPDATIYRKLFVVDLQTGRRELAFSTPDGGGLDENNLSAAEKLSRERSRDRWLGVTRYQWKAARAQPSCPSTKLSFMVPLPSGVYVQDLGSTDPELKLPSIPGSPIIDPQLSPDGSLLAFVKDDELHVLNLSDGKVKQLTFGARETQKTHGLAEYIAQEEMDRKAGFWWSPNSKFIAFVEVDASEIPLFRIMHQGENIVGLDAQEDHAYPFAGAANVKVRLGVAFIEEGTISWMDLLCGGTDLRYADAEYLARVNWMPGPFLVAQVLNRSHTHLKVLKFDIFMGQKEVLLEEYQDIWISLHDCFTPLDNSVNKFTGGFIWASEKTGYKHLYLYDKNGTLLGPITQGDWMVEQIVGVNENAGLVYFIGTLDGPLESNLYCASLFPDWDRPLPPPRRLTHERGRHAVILDHQMQKFVDIHDSLSAPPRVVLCSLLDGSLLMPLYEQPLSIPRLSKLQLSPPEIVQIMGPDGTTLYGAVYKPDEKRFGPPPYKTMINVYGGPGIQLVCDSWINTVDMRVQYLRSKGILVWKLDNRGTSRRGLTFEGHLKGNIGRVDTEDQLTGAQWLVKQGLAKEGSIGIYGWSYGGFLSAMALTRFPETFRCAVSGAPVTAWDGYDTFYTEKYMGLPPENPDGYAFASVMHHVDNLEGKLLLVHGMIDENVHFRHTARLVNALNTASKRYELLIFPGERHMPRQHDNRAYMEGRIWEFIERNL